MAETDDCGKSLGDALGSNFLTRLLIDDLFDHLRCLVTWEGTEVCHGNAEGGTLELEYGSIRIGVKYRQLSDSYEFIAEDQEWVKDGE